MGQWYESYKYDSYFMDLYELYKDNSLDHKDTPFTLSKRIISD
jgi:hypothetical protein